MSVMKVDFGGCCVKRESERRMRGERTEGNPGYRTEEEE